MHLPANLPKIQTRRSIYFSDSVMTRLTRIADNFQKHLIGPPEISKVEALRIAAYMVDSIMFPINLRKLKARLRPRFMPNPNDVYATPVLGFIDHKQKANADILELERKLIAIEDLKHFKEDPTSTLPKDLIDLAANFLLDIALSSEDDFTLLKQSQQSIREELQRRLPELCDHPHIQEEISYEIQRFSKH